MAASRSNRLERPVDLARDHVLGDPEADITLVEYGSYVCAYCHAAHEVIGRLRERFGTRMRYVYRHLPLADREEATRAAELAEYASGTGGGFWAVHDALMERGPIFDERDLERLGGEFGVPPRDRRDPAAARAAAIRVREDASSGLHSGARVTPTFFIGDRRYEGAWDETALAEAMLRPPGQRLHAVSVDFARWAPSTGLLLLLMTALALVISNTPFGPTFESWWHAPFGLRLGGGAYLLPLIDWVNEGLLSVFFLVVGLEIKRELTVGRLATRRSAALPVVAALGGMVAPALLFLLVIPSGPLSAGWGTTIATDTAFAIALIVLLGDRVPLDLRVFLTAAAIVDDLVAIAVVALFYSGDIDARYIAASAVVTGSLVLLNRWSVYRALPYLVLGVVLWACLHAAGLHATLAGVVLALVTPTRPPANLPALMAQAEAVLDAESRLDDGAATRHGPSESALRALDAIHDRIESPASRVLRSVEPWSSYVVLPVFALANAGVAWSADLLGGHTRLVLAIVLGLVVGKPAGIVLGASLAVRLGVAVKPATYSWRQLLGAGTLAGIGFTISLFIAGEAFPREADFAAAKIAVFLASLIAGILGVVILWPKPRAERAVRSAPGVAATASAGDGGVPGDRRDLPTP
jgi:NhaA family Na+:H+ antiporter